MQQWVNFIIIIIWMYDKNIQEAITHKLILKNVHNLQFLSSSKSKEWLQAFGIWRIATETGIYCNLGFVLNTLLECIYSKIYNNKKKKKLYFE